MGQVVVRQTSRLAASADAVWQALLRADTFAFVTRGLLGFSARGAMPEHFAAGTRVQGRLWLAHVLPAWCHTLEIEHIDPSTREIRTRESGGLMRQWNHLLRVEPDGAGACFYTDEIRFEAPGFSAVAAPLVRWFFRYRHWRWQRLATKLAADPHSQRAGS